MTGQAIADFNQIREGDRILVAVSGGKDSLSLLHTLVHFARHAPIKFSIGAVTINPLSEDFDPSSLKLYIPGLGIEYFFVSEPIVELAQKHMQKDSFCAFCSRMRRGLMYKTARENNYNVLALGQHLDDLAESFLMSAFHGGRLKTMKAHYQNDAGDVRVIRPFVYLRESKLRAFAAENELPVIKDNCPACFGKPTQRMSMKAILAAQEKTQPTLFNTLLTTLKPLMSEGLSCISQKPTTKTA